MRQANVIWRLNLPLGRFSLLFGRFNAKGVILFNLGFYLASIRRGQAIMFFGFYLKPFLGFRR